MFSCPMKLKIQNPSTQFILIEDRKFINLTYAQPPYFGSLLPFSLALFWCSPWLLVYKCHYHSKVRAILTVFRTFEPITKIT